MTFLNGNKIEITNALDQKTFTVGIFVDLKLGLAQSFNPM